MTTIACDGQLMAGDGLVTREGMIVGQGVAKVWRARDGAILGGAGTYGFDKALTAWWEAGAEGAFPHGKEINALILKPDGSCLFVGDCGYPTEQELPTAIGSGCEYALGAMDAGATAEQAVAIAAKRNPTTGGKITAIRLGFPPDRLADMAGL
jgi:ATP-dependent protease HslVU (ClpYQ) peptidase subunit